MTQPYTKQTQSLLVQNCGQSDTSKCFPCQLSFHQCPIFLFYSSTAKIVGRIGTRYGLHGPEIEYRRGRDFNILSVAPYNDSDGKLKHVAVFPNKYAVFTEIPSIWSSKSYAKDALGILNYDLEICTAILTICIYIYLVWELLITWSFPHCSFANHSRSSMPSVAERPGRKKIKFCTGD